VVLRVGSGSYQLRDLMIQKVVKEEIANSKITMLGWILSIVALI
jgi:hypothetical protein